MVNATLKGTETHHLHYHLPGCVCGDKAGKAWFTASGRYYPFIPHLLSTILLQGSKQTANLFPGSHLTSSRHQLICDHLPNHLRSRQRSQPGWYTLRLAGGIWHVLLGYYACSHSYWSIVYIMCPAVPCMLPCTSNSLQSKGPTLM